MLRRIAARPKCNSSAKVTRERKCRSSTDILERQSHRLKESPNMTAVD